MPKIARKASPVALIATGRSDDLNQVNNVRWFPFIFRGTLDAEATEINEAMTLTCAEAIAALAWKPATSDVRQAYRGEELIFGRDHLIPKPFDPLLLPRVAHAVAEAAIKSGVGTENRIQRTTKPTARTGPLNTDGRSGVTIAKKA